MTGLLRRSELAVPASNDNMFEKGAGCGADLVFLDLEDAVPAAFKEESRVKAIAALNDIDWGRTARAIRINGLDTQWCHDDVIDVVTKAGENLDTIIIPKARTARDVWWVDVLLTQLESKLGLTQPDSARSSDRRGGRPSQRRGDRSGQPAAGRLDLRCGRLLAVAGCTGGHQLRPARRIPR